jgi:hypothetical protein
MPFYWAGARRVIDLEYSGLKVLDIYRLAQIADRLDGAAIAQTPERALEALRRAYSMEGVFMFSDEGPVFLAWPKQPGGGVAGRIREWLRDWQHETCASGIA